MNKYNTIYQKFAPDIVIHLAAVSHANKSNKDPHYTFDNSLRTLENTLDICRSKKTHVIFFRQAWFMGILLMARSVKKQFVNL